jgi:hypothetical protein
VQEAAWKAFAIVGSLSPLSFPELHGGKLWGNSGGAQEPDSGAGGTALRARVALAFEDDGRTGLALRLREQLGRSSLQVDVLADLRALVGREAGAGRDQVTEDDVLLEADEVVPRPASAASVSTLVVSWKEAAEMNESTAGRLGDAQEQRRGLGGLLLLLMSSLFSSGSGTCPPPRPAGTSLSPGSSMCTLRIIWATMISMCLSSIVTPCAR